ncbi:Putative flagella-related protein D [Methanocaldococcus lauensis]|nr:Putative flagella-related protein D [Methanocaldococcus lauensis]
MIQKTMNETSHSSNPVFSDEDFLTEDEIEEYLNTLKPPLPSFVVILIKNNLRGKRVTKRQLEKIVERIREVLSKGRVDKSEELNKKLQTLEQKLDTIMKLTTRVFSTKVSEKIENTSKKSDLITIEKPKENWEIKEEIDKIEVIKKPVKKEITEKIDETKKEILESKKEDIKKVEGIFKEDIKEKEQKPLEIPEEGVYMQATVEKEKYYRLNDIPEDAVSTTLVFKWLEFLISKCGITNLPDILDYYNEIGWISDKVILKLLRFAKNMKIIINTENIKPKDKLSPSDHIMSLLYIEKLAGRPVNSEVLEMLEIEIRRIKKWAEGLQLI